jgi:Cdc6-like AAA superfamily ATPase
VTFKGKNDKIEEAKSRLATLFEDERGLVLAKNYAATQEAKDIASRTDARALNIEETTERTEANTMILMSAISGMLEKYIWSGLYLTNNRFPRHRQGYGRSCIAQRDFGSVSLDKVRKAQREFADQLDMIDHHEKKAAQWFQNLDLFKDWMEKKAPILWILGPSGTGKSCLTPRIIEYLRSRFPQDPEHPVRISVAYFYISSEDQEMRSLDVILKSIAYQISPQRSSIQNLCIKCM